MQISESLELSLYQIYFLSKRFLFFTGKEEEIYEKLKSAAEQTRKFKVYKRGDIPKRYHYGDNTRIGSIFVIAELGYAFQNLYDAIDYYKRKFNITGNFLLCRYLFLYLSPYCFQYKIVTSN